MHSRFATLFAAFMLALLCSNAFCQNHTWIGPAAGVWSSAANWNGGVPTSGEAGGTVVIFGTNTSSVMDINGLTVNGIQFTAGGNIINGNGTTLTLNTASVTNNIDADGATNTIGGTIAATALPIALTGTATCFIKSDTGVLTINSNISGTTNVRVIGLGANGVTYTGQNTYTGTTTVAAGILSLNSAGIDKSIQGNVVVGTGAGTGAVLFLTQSLEIANTSTVTVNADGTFNMNAKSETVGTLTVNGGDVTLGAANTLVVNTALSMTGGTISSTGAVLSLMGDVTATSTATATPTISCPISLNGNRQFTVNPGALTNDLTLTNVISDGNAQSSFNKLGLGILLMSTPNNTYTGATNAIRGTISLNGPGNAVIPGILNIGDATGLPGSAIVRLLQNSEIANTSVVAVNPDGLLDLNNLFDAFAGLVVTSGSVTIGTGTLDPLAQGIQMNGGTITATGAGKITLDGNILATSAGGGATITSNIALTADRTITVNPGNTPAPELTINGVVSGAFGFMKSGTGTLFLRGVVGNTYTGTTTVDKGVLQLNQAAGNTIIGTLIIGNNADPAGSAVLRELQSSDINPAVPITINSSGKFDLNGFTDNVGAVAGTGQISIPLGSNLNVNSDNSSSSFGGTITGAGFFRKAGTGLFSLTGANPFTGKMICNEGGLILNSVTPDVACQAGTLQVGDGVGNANSAIVLLLAANQISATTALDIKADGQFSLNNLTETLGAVSITSTGNISMGTGTLTLGGDLTMNDGSIAPATGTLNLGGNVIATSTATGAVITSPTTLNGTRNFTINAGAVQPELHLNAVVTDGSVVSGLTKLGNGTLQLHAPTGSGGNLFTGTTTALAGVLQLKADSGRAIRGPFIIGNDTDPADTAIVRNLVLINVLNTVDVTINKSGQFDLNNFSDNAGSLTGSGKIALGSAQLSVGNNNTNTAFSGVISGTGSLGKIGTGTLTLSANNTYSGNTNIIAGELVVNGLQSGPATVSAGGTLSGTGKLGDLTVNGIFKPTNAPFATGNLAINAAGKLNLNLNSTTPGTFSSLNVTGTVTVNAAATLNLTADPGVGLPVNNKLVLITNDSNDAITGAFANVANNSTVTLNGVDYKISYLGASGNDLDITATNAVPVVSTPAQATPNPAGVNQQVSFNVAATDGNNDTLTYQWNFGDSGNATGQTPTHSYLTVGTFNAVCTITDGNGGMVQSSVMVNVTPAPVTNVAPVVSSPAAATPNPAGVGQSVAFLVAATDANNDALAYSWDFGDAANGSGPGIAHTYAAAGVYNAVCTINDGKGGSTTSSVSVTINAPIVGTGNDSDGDGFSDAFETATGSSPSNAADSPTGGPATAPAALVIAKLSIKLNFSKPAADSITFSGTLPIPAGLKVDGQKVAVDIGGVAKSFTLSSKGVGGDKTNSFKIGVKAKKGVVAAQTAKYSVSLKNGSFAAALADEGLLNKTDPGSSHPVLITVIFNKTIDQLTKTVTYKAKQDKSGSTK